MSFPLYTHLTQRSQLPGLRVGPLQGTQRLCTSAMLRSQLQAVLGNTLLSLQCTAKEASVLLMYYTSEVA